MLVPPESENSSFSQSRQVFNVARAIWKTPYVWTGIAGALISFTISPRLVYIVLPWRRPIQDWMTAHGLGAYAGHYALVNLRLPDIFLCLIGGVCIGLLSHRRWRVLAMVYSLAYVLAPYLVFIGPIWAFDHATILQMLGWALLTTIPFTILGAYIASRFSRRRHARLHAREYCSECGYNLHGNVSGRCPECGASIPGGGAGRPSPSASARISP